MKSVLKTIVKVVVAFGVPIGGLVGGEYFIFKGDILLGGVCMAIGVLVALGMVFIVKDF